MAGIGIFESVVREESDKMKNEVKNMKICWKCGNTVTDDEVICSECNEPLDEPDEKDDFDLGYEDDNENGEI